MNPQYTPGFNPTRYVPQGAPSVRTCTCMCLLCLCEGLCCVYNGARYIDSKKSRRREYVYVHVHVLPSPALLSYINMYHKNTCMRICVCGCVFARESDTYICVYRCTRHRDSRLSSSSRGKDSRME